jgi:hypothetical protein
LKNKNKYAMPPLTLHQKKQGYNGVLALLNRNIKRKQPVPIFRTNSLCVELRERK